MKQNYPLFLISLIVGITVGLLYGWVINPAQIETSSPDSLRQDYRTDYILIIAESYTGDLDLDLARERLTALGSAEHAGLVRDALEYARDMDFLPEDIQNLELLLSDLPGQPTAPEAGL